MGKTELTQANLEGQAYEVVKAFYPDVIHLQFQMEECHKMLTDKIDWTNPEGDQVRIDINRPLPLSGPPTHVTIQTQFFFNNDFDYLQYGSKGRRPALSISKMKAARYHDFGLELLVPEYMWISDVCTYDISASYVRTHMRILIVVSIKSYSRYGYDYLKAITLRKADYQEYTIVEKDFKNLYPSDFEGLNLMLLQALDYRVKEYKVNQLNSGMNTRFWTAKDVTKSKEFIHAIERRLKTRRIFQNLECFVGGRVRDREPNEHIISTFRSVLTGSGGSSKDIDGDTSFQ
ncbi:hypothetical protein Tco_0935269 [Tanacetum coccineum]